MHESAIMYLAHQLEIEDYTDLGNYLLRKIIKYQHIIEIKEKNLDTMS